ncbi:FAD-dependent oxidoreductase [Kribbella antibiotica]|uniref:FAD-dependent oxidoreductase n=1 Tax=Kribbella antibiotica TaxID=190195 RepID=A0A4V2YN51_9ACTN|nr:FAD-dependent monooxygenase [Kribbella antibiotica]TDD52927.1 FAD-dependent oxidoreductase [Kribbella antibiotica]
MDTDVVIAGAGPNGLLLAAELRLAGVRPIVLERLTERSTEQRANGLVGQVVRALDRRGLAEPLGSEPGGPVPRPEYIFAAMRLALQLIDNNPVYILPSPQAKIEAVLEERALELGAELRRGHELADFTQDDDGVTVEVAGPDGTYSLRARFLVGADGGHSRTRKLAGIDFPGVTHDATVSRGGHASIPAEYIDPATGVLRIPGYGDVPPFMHHRSDRGLFAYAPFPGRQPLVHTSEWDEPDTDEMTFSELQESVDRVLGVHLPLIQESPFVRRNVGGNTRIAERFRAGRVLLVGDAAHVHSAMGGPGLNLGLQDVLNLGWKLAAEVQGWAPEGLLDTYESERRPVGERVVMQTQAQSALVAPGPEVTALRAMFAELLTEPATVQHIADLISGADIRYFDGRHPLIGRAVPDLTVDGVRLAEILRSGRPVLLDLLDGSPYASHTNDHVDLVTGSSDRQVAMLIRPDGYIAWAADDANADGLEDALDKWFQGRVLTKATT